MPKLGRVFQGKPGGRSRVWWPEPCVRERKKVVARLLHGTWWHVGDANCLLGCPAVTGLPPWIWAPEWRRLLTCQLVFDLGCSAVTGLEASRPAAGAGGSLGRLICG
ncbi:unnamed protein product [Prunus armeniaca]